MSFRLQSLLRLRHLQRDAAAARAGQTARRAAEAQGHTRELLDELSATSFASHGDARTFAAVVAARSASTSRYQESLVAAEQASAEASAAERAWTAARTRARGLERLEEQHADAEREAALHAEQAVLDEIGTRTRPTAPTTTPAAPTADEEDQP